VKLTVPLGDRARYQPRRNRPLRAFAVPGRNGRQYFTCCRRRTASGFADRRRRGDRSRRWRVPPPSVGFQKGDIILAVNNQKIAKTSDLDKASKTSSRLWRITVVPRRPADQRGRWADEPEATSRGGQSLRRGGDGAGRAAAVAGPVAHRSCCPMSSVRITSSVPTGALTRMLATRTLGSAGVLGDRPAPARPRWRGCWRMPPKLHFEQISAVFSGVADLKKVFAAARARARWARARCCSSTRCIVSSTAPSRISFLPVMEDGTVVLVGATTENPSFELNAALACRGRGGCWCIHSPRSGRGRTNSMRTPKRSRAKKLPLDAEARVVMVRMADGDGRAALTLAEEVWRAAAQGRGVQCRAVADILQRRAPIYDKSADGHYNLISALHKSGTRLRSGCSAVLSRTHDGCRRRSAVSRAPRGADGGRGHWVWPIRRRW